MGLPDPRVRPDDGALALGCRVVRPDLARASSALLDAVAFAILLGTARLSRTRRIAAWWWVGFLALLGPIALGRIDAVTVPLAITGLLFAAGRPRVAAVLLTVGAWVKVWPAALSSPRSSSPRAGGSRSSPSPPRSARASSGEHRGRRGRERHRLRRRAGGPRPPGRGAARAAWLWQIVAGSTDVTIVYDRDILTFQIDGPGADVAAALTTPLMIVGVAVVVLFGVRAALRRRTSASCSPRSRSGSSSCSWWPTRWARRSSRRGSRRRSSSASCTGPRGSRCPPCSPPPSPCSPTSSTRTGTAGSSSRTRHSCSCSR